MTIDELLGIDKLNYKTRIHLETQSDVLKFLDIITKNFDDDNVIIKLADCADGIINAKSILGYMALMSWKEVWVYSNVDVYTQIKEFAI